jgi:hypothetical protein
MTTKVTSWSPSRYEKYTACPHRFKLEALEKLCPHCFQGQLTGPWGEPQICAKCHAVEETPDPILRGTRLHKEIEVHILTGKKLDPDLKHVKKFITALKKKTPIVEVNFVFTAGWKPTGKFTKGAWLRANVDALTIEGDGAEVIDWKSGGIDKRTLEVRADEKYDDQLEVYGIATLCARPQVNRVQPKLVFLDAPKDNVVERGSIFRKELPALKAKWEKKLKPLFGDTVFAPKPSDKCRWCPFSKTKGGPCKF